MNDDDTPDIYEIALFNGAPKVGDVNPPGEVSYEGYRRMPMPTGKRVTPVHFPSSPPGVAVTISHAVLFRPNGDGVVRHVMELGKLVMPEPPPQQRVVTGRIEPMDGARILRKLQEG